jgi:hypothetical protein
VRDESPGNSENARIALERPFRKLRELAIIAAREIVVNFADLLIHDVKIVNQPFRRRHDDLIFADCLGDGTIGLEQHPAVVCEPSCQRPAGRWFRSNALSGRKTLRMLFEPFDAEQFAPNRFFSILREYSPRTPEGAKYGMLQECLSGQGEPLG